jgi:hypothetical protein
MRFHPTGLVVFAVVVLLALVGGAMPAVAVVRLGLVLFVVAAFVEVAVNMLRHRDTHIRGRSWGLLVENATTLRPSHKRP